MFSFSPVCCWCWAGRGRVSLVPGEGSKLKGNSKQQLLFKQRCGEHILLDILELCGYFTVLLAAGDFNLPHDAVRNMLEDMCADSPWRFRHEYEGVWKFIVMFRFLSISYYVPTRIITYTPTFFHRFTNKQP